MQTKFSACNSLSPVLKDQKLFLSHTGRAHLTGGSISEESPVCSSKGQALQYAYGLDFLSIQASQLWMEYPSRGKDEYPLARKRQQNLRRQDAVLIYLIPP